MRVLLDVACGSPPRLPAPCVCNFHMYMCQSPDLLKGKEAPAKCRLDKGWKWG